MVYIHIYHRYDSILGRRAVALACHYIFALMWSGSTRSSTFLIHLFVCSASVRVKIYRPSVPGLNKTVHGRTSILTVCGRIRARWAKYPLYTAKRPSVFTVR